MAKRYFGTMMEYTTQSTLQMSVLNNVEVEPLLSCHLPKHVRFSSNQNVVLPPTGFPKHHCPSSFLLAPS